MKTYAAQTYDLSARVALEVAVQDAIGVLRHGLMPVIVRVYEGGHIEFRNRTTAEVADVRAEVRNRLRAAATTAESLLGRTHA